MATRESREKGVLIIPRRWGWAILGAGIVVSLVSLFADPLGLGGEPGFGYKQGVGVLLGLILVVVGLRRSKSHNLR